jgi:carotenoid cleavage dioxygenase
MATNNKTTQNGDGYTEIRTAFPKQPQFSGFMKPCRYQGEVNHLEVHGTIPSELDGTFYRVMPDPQLPPMHEDDPVCSSQLF